MEIFFQPGHRQDDDYIDTHIHSVNMAELALVTRDLRRKGVVPQGFEFHGSCASMVHFFTTGFSSVRFFHAHLDRVFSFSMGTREWRVVNPKHHGKFEREWTIHNNVMATRELVGAPRVSIVQEKGDILVLPPWWYHKTLPVDSTEERGVNFNIHVLAKGQFLGEAARLLRSWGLFRPLRSK